MAFLSFVFFSMWKFFFLIYILTFIRACSFVAWILRRKLTVLFSWFLHPESTSLSFGHSFTLFSSLCIRSMSSYRAEIVKQRIYVYVRRERERQRAKKVSSSHSCCPWKKNCFLAEQTYSLLTCLLTLFSILFTATAVATAYAFSLQPLPFALSLSPSLSRIQWNHITKKRVNETKITIHHRTKKKNKGFLTNNNDRHVTNMNSSFLSSFCSYLHSIIFAFWREEEEE